MRCVLALLPVLCGCLFDVSHAAEPASKAAIDKYQKLQEEYKSREDELRKLIEAAKEVEHEKIFATSSPRNTMADKFLELEREYRGTIVGFSCLHHLVAAGGSTANESPAWICKAKAIEILRAHYANDPNFDYLVETVNSRVKFEDPIQSLLECAADSPHRHIRASALFEFAQNSELNSMVPQAHRHLRSLLTEADAGTPMVKFLDKIEPLYRGTDVEAERHRALELIDVILEEYADVPVVSFPGHSPVLLELERKHGKDNEETYGQLAEQLKYEMTHLAPGQKPPDINQPDAFGKPLHLYDHRGKVVVLMFSFKGCGPCEAMYPDNRKLIEEMKGRPFAFLGVMGDETIETVHEAVEGGKITWPVWWNGNDKEISRQWNVRGWPGIYVLDHTGTIRYKGLRHELLSRAVRKLVAEAEAAE